jgi:molybdenum-dependent DNA-binding transcriptional regulator ModE
MTGRWTVAAHEARLLEDALEQARGGLRRAGGATWVARAGDSYRAELDRQQRRLDRLLTDLEHARRSVLQHLAAADAADAARGSVR